MVFTNPIMTIHVNKTTNRPPMSSIVVGGYINTYAGNLGGGYKKPFVITTRISDDKNGHYVRPNRVTFKYPDF